MHSVALIGRERQRMAIDICYSLLSWLHRSGGGWAVAVCLSLNG